MKYQPRIPNITAVIGYDVLTRREKDLMDELETVKSRPDYQPGYFFLASSYQITAIDQWVLGWPMESVIDLLKKSVEAETSVLRLRATSTYTETRYPRDGQGPGVTTTKVNYGTGNSWDAFDAACIALAVGLPSAATTIAEMIWDPPDADYIFRSGDAMRPEQQKVAYAFRDLYLGRTPETLNDLRRISLLWKARNFPKNAAYCAAIVLSLATQDKTLATESLVSLIRWYSIKTPPNYEKDRYEYLHLPALGLAALLISRGLTSADQLPLNAVRFPRDFLDPAVAALRRP